MIFETNQEKNDGMEVVEKATELFVLLTILAVGGMAREVSESIDSGCKKVKKGIKEGCECIKEGYKNVKDGVQNGLKTLQKGMNGHCEAVKEDMDCIKPFSLNRMLQKTTQKVETEIKEPLFIKQFKVRS